MRIKWTLGIVVAVLLTSGCSNDTQNLKSSVVLEANPKNCTTENLSALKAIDEKAARALGSACFRGTPFVYYSGATDTVTPILLDDEGCAPGNLEKYKDVKGGEELTNACSNRDIANNRKSSQPRSWSITDVK